MLSNNKILCSEKDRRNPIRRLKCKIICFDCVGLASIQSKWWMIAKVLVKCIYAWCGVVCDPNTVNLCYVCVCISHQAGLLFRNKFLPIPALDHFKIKHNLGNFLPISVFVYSPNYRLDLSNFSVFIFILSTPTIYSTKYQD